MGYPLLRAYLFHSIAWHGVEIIEAPTPINRIFHFKNALNSAGSRFFCRTAKTFESLSHQYHPRKGSIWITLIKRGQRMSLHVRLSSKKS